MIEWSNQRIRYFPLVSVHEPDIDGVLYTPIANQIGIAVFIE